MERRPYFVTFRPEFAGSPPDEVADKLSKSRGVSFLNPGALPPLSSRPEVRHDLGYHAGLVVTVYLDEEERAGLTALPIVEDVELDRGLRLPGVRAPLESWVSEKRRPDWWLKEFKGDLFHQAGSLGQAINVAVVDSGVASDHYQVKVEPEHRETFLPKGEGDANVDLQGHGTHCAGIIGSTFGVAPKATLFSLQVLDSDLKTEWQYVWAALQWCLHTPMPIHLVNLSLGGTTPPRPVSVACDALHAKGTLVIAAAGNAPGKPVDAPAAFRNVAAVSGLDGSQKPSSTSSYGPEVELAAPGESIESAAGSKYQTGVRSGTSAAAPFVAGCAALIWSANVKLTNDQVFGVLAACGTNSANWDMRRGYGRAQMDQALTLAQNPPQNPALYWRP